MVIAYMEVTTTTDISIWTKIIDGIPIPVESMAISQACGIDEYGNKLQLHVSGMVQTSSRVDRDIKFKTTFVYLCK